MKIYFWDGSEFKNSASPCCEIHTKTHRIKLLVIGKRYTKLLYMERL